MSNFAELIENLEHNRDEAVQELVGLYGNHILRVVRRHLGRKMRIRFDSEDFVQAVWATLFVKSSAFRDIQNEGQLIAFLTQIAFHKVIDERRANTLAQRRNMNREVPLAGPDQRMNQAAAAEATPSEYLMADEELQKLNAEIPTEQRWMIDCRIQGMTYEAIARKGGVTERTVRRVFDRLRRKIAES
jgi:RNA polymerase sigma factor (sigma-70 family)